MSYTPVLDRLFRTGRISLQEVEDAVGGTSQSPEKVLVNKGTLTITELLQTLSRIYGVPAVELAHEQMDPSCATLVPPDVTVRKRVLPLRREGNKLIVAMEDPSDLATEDQVRIITGYDIKRVAVLGYELDELLRGDETVPESKALAEIKALDTVWEEVPEVPIEDCEEVDGEHDDDRMNSQPIVRAVAIILRDAVKRKASDVHLDPTEKGLQVRYRLDGTLQKVLHLPRLVQPMVVSRIKLMAGMDISEKWRPQDGRLRMEMDQQLIDFRLSTLPTFNGERLVLRILDRNKSLPVIEEMGMRDRDLRVFLDMLRRPQGMILLTGPAGSGTTTTLYSALSRLQGADSNIITVEDPVEYQIPGISQVQVNPKAGLGFATALRSILRQDPDVVMVGEIRDLETAAIAFEAASSGHLVLSTLHTSDAPSAVSRLLHLGVPHYMVASSLLGVVAQRLVRRLCINCRIPSGLWEEHADLLRNSSVAAIPDEVFAPLGCDKCARAGYSGRFGIFEILRMTDQIRAAIYANKAECDFRVIARRQGMNTLLEDGLRKCASGDTSIEELLKVVPAGAECDEGESAARA